MPERLTGGAWASKLGVEIVDPDGWRAAGIPFDQPITLDEYNRLAATSTQRPARTPTEPAAELEQASGAHLLHDIAYVAHDGGLVNLSEYEALQLHLVELIQDPLLKHSLG